MSNDFSKGGLIVTGRLFICFRIVTVVAIRRLIVPGKPLAMVVRILLTALTCVMLFLGARLLAVWLAGIVASDSVLAGVLEYAGRNRFFLISILAFAWGALTTVFTAVLDRRDETALVNPVLLTECEYGMFKGLGTIVPPFLIFAAAIAVLFLSMAPVLFGERFIETIASTAIAILGAITPFLLASLLFMVPLALIPPRGRTVTGFAMAILLVGLMVGASTLSTLPELTLSMYNIANPFAWGEMLHQQAFKEAGNPWLASALVCGMVAVAAVLVTTLRPLFAKAYRSDEGREITARWPLAGYAPETPSRYIEKILDVFPITEGSLAFLVKDFLVGLRSGKVALSLLIAYGVIIAFFLGQRNYFADLFMLYLLPTEVAASFVQATSKAEGNSLDIVRIQSREREYLTCKSVTTHFFVFLLSVLPFVVYFLLINRTLGGGAFVMPFLTLVISSWASSAIALATSISFVKTGRGSPIETVCRFLLGCIAAAGAASFATFAGNAVFGVAPGTLATPVLLVTVAIVALFCVVIFSSVRKRALLGAIRGD